jgi:transposase
MRKIRDVLRMRFENGLSERVIARSLSLSNGSVNSYLQRARMAGIRWPLPENLDDTMLERLLFPPAPAVATDARPTPDWALVDKELRRAGVTLALLWEEYRAAHPDGFGYSWFCEHYGGFKRRLRPTMRQSHVAGEKLFVDFAGDTIDVIDPVTGEVRPMKLFVAAMGDTLTPFFLASSLATRVWPQAGCSIAMATTAASTSGATRFFNNDRLWRGTAA